MRSLVDVRVQGLFIIVVTSCSGQPAPAPVIPVVPPPVEITGTPDAPPPAILGASCDDQRLLCGPELTCDASLPGGSCIAACSAPGTACGTGICVEYPTIDVCHPSCTTNDDCRAGEGYACDPVWKGCVLANRPTIAPLACAPPTGIARDPAFAPATSVAGGGEVAAATTDTGVVMVYERPARQGLAVVRLDHAGRLGGAALDAEASSPALARDGAVLHLVATRGRSVVISTSKDGSSWPSARVFETECGVGDCTPPAIAVGNDPQKRRTIYVAYPVSNGIRVRASRDGGATFTPAVTALPGTRGSLAVSGDGALHVVALRGSARGSYGSGDHEILYSSSIDGGRSFTKPRLISRDGDRIPFYYGAPRIEVDSARKWIYVAYTRGGRDGKWDIALVATTDKKLWVRSSIGEPSCTQFAPQLALDPTSGGLHVGWYDSRGSRYAHAVCVEGLRGCRQLGRINSEPFAGLSLSRHGLHAASEATALVVDTARRTLHAVWSQSVATEARIFHAKAKLPLR